MQPRGYWGTSLILAVTAGIPFAIVWTLLIYAMQGDFRNSVSAGITAGIMFGLGFGLIMARFIKVVTVSIPFQDKQDFVSKMNIALAEIGYHPESQTETLHTFKPSLFAGLLSGKISVQIETASATLVGPSMYVRKLQKKFGLALAKKSHKVALIVSTSIIAFFVLIGVVLYRLDTSDNEIAEKTGSSASSTTAPTAASSLEQVLARTAGIGAVKLDSVTTSTKGTDKVTAYLKGNKIRMDVNAGGQPMVLLVFTDNRTQVAYDPTQKSGQMQAIAVGDDTFDKFSFAEIAKTILKEAPAVLGPETIDGRAALLIEGKHEKGNMYRAWIDTEHGLPLRTEDWQVDGKLVTESKNVEFFYLPDSVFEIPAGVKLTTVPASSPKPTTTPTPISAELPVTVPRLYVHPQYHYSIEVPAGWTMRQKDTDNVIFESPDLMMFVQVFGYQKRGNLETFLNSTVAYRVKTQDYQEFSRKEGLLPGSLRAWTLNTQWTNPGSTVLGRKLQVLAVKGDRALELIGGVSAANWNKYSAQLEQIAYTLAMED